MRQRADVKGEKTTTAAMAISAASRGLALALAVAGCVSNSGMLVVLQNQQPIFDETTHSCSAGPTPSAAAVGIGVLDLDTTSAPAALPAYTAYPLVQNLLPARAAMAGAIEPNAVNVEGVRTTIHPPPGVTVTWAAGCPATFLWPSTATLLPAAALTLPAQVVLPCHAKVIHDLFVSGDLPSDFSQQVLFNVEMRVVGTVNGSELDSDAFRFSVRMCIGCLQTGFDDTAQFNYPARPSCSAAPNPNTHKGNPCNVAQDFGPLLCCNDNASHIICPAPSTPSM